jgi:hypothetical protein
VTERRRLLVAPEVSGLLPRHTRRHLDTLAAGRRTCFICQAAIGREDPAAVLAIRDPAGGKVVLTTAHASCHSSAVIDRPLDQARLASIRWAPAVIQGPKPRAVLAVLHGRELLTVTADGEAESPLRDLLVARGFRLITDVITEQAGRIVGWSCELQRDGRVAVRTDQDALELETNRPLSEEWIAVARSAEAIMLLEVVDAPATDDAGAEVLRALAEARCFAGMVDVA